MSTNKRSHEFEGVTAEDAINNALKTLNVSREMITVKVVCEEQKGLFGMEGSKTAKIKVTLRGKSQA